MQLYQVDAFTATAFAGNPAAVCILPAGQTPPDAWMQAMAQEMNLSETAFLRRQADGSFRLRWFTPAAEVDLCGHATLASAHVLWSEGFLAADAPASFDTASGRLTATRHLNDAERWIRLDFPADPVTTFDEDADEQAALRDAFRLSDSDVVETGTSERDLLVRVASSSVVRGLAPDLSAVANLHTRGVIVTAEADGEADDLDGVDVVSRFFAPQVGVPEDPVTGSAHCALAPFWAERLGRTDLTARQLSARGGTVRLHLDAPDADRVALDGQAVTIFQAQLGDLGF